MAKKPTSKKKPTKRKLEQYEHGGHERANNPHVGLVTPQTDPPPPPEQARKKYRYDPHLDPELNFDPQAVRDELGETIDQGLADEPAGEVDDAADEAERLRAELERTRRHLSRATESLGKLKAAQSPYLNWAGKAERTSFEVPTVSLHVHERIDPRTIIEAVRAKNGNGHDPQGSLFEKPESNRPLREAVEFYKHPHGWTNRLIAGDSLLVMNSLLEKEGMAGKVQMVYIDPPYGIRYKSNFQPFVSSRSVSDNDADDDLTREPETLRAFRDTWELDIHSYLAYLRDRAKLAWLLLNKTGSLFVQIDDDNVHRVRAMLDEICGADHFVVTIPIKKKGSQKSSRMDPVNDYLLWYGRSPRRDKNLSIKFRPIFRQRDIDYETLNEFKYVEFPDGSVQKTRQLKGPDGVVRDYRLQAERFRADFPGVRLFRRNPLKAGGTRANQSLPYTIDGKQYNPGVGRCWKHTVRTNDGSLPGMDRLAIAGRLIPTNSDIRFKSYLDDFGYQPLSNWWDGLGGASDPIYVVQTNEEIVARCILMTTDPGDLVFDPTCGSGTTAVAAERWGRRWITCDSSRVAVTLAKQRICTQTFEFFRLRDVDLGITGGFDYNSALHVQPSDIANNPDIKPGAKRADIDAAIKRHATHRDLIDSPKRDQSKARIAGPFTTEAVPAPYGDRVVSPIAESNGEPDGDVSIGRGGETLRQSEWREELLRTGTRGEGGLTMEFVRVEPLPGARWLHAEAEIKDDGSFRGKTWKRGDRVVVAFGPQYAPMEQRFVEDAWREAATLHPKPDHVLFVAFQFDPEAAKDIDGAPEKSLGMTFFRCQMNDDLHTDDLKKKRSSNESFWLIGQPDVSIEQIAKGEDKGKYIVQVNGFDYFNMKEQTVDSGGADKIAMWMLDTDYDERSLYPRQVFFPMAGPKEGWQRLAKTLKAEIDEELIEAYRGTKSLPFEPGRHRKVAIKVVDDRGFESLVVKEL